jgi:hypothetical protein
MPQLELATTNLIIIQHAFKFLEHRRAEQELPIVGPELDLTNAEFSKSFSSCYGSTQAVLLNSNCCTVCF